MPEDKSRPQESKKVKPMFAGASFVGSAAPHSSYPPGYTLDQALQLNHTRVEQKRLDVEKRQIEEAERLRKALEERNRHDDHAELKSWIQLAIGAAQRREARAAGPSAVIPEAAQAAGKHRNGSSRSRSQILINLRCSLREMKANGDTQRDMCKRLDANRTPTPEGVQWDGLTWHKAYLSPKHNGKVKKWLSKAAKVTA